MEKWEKDILKIIKDDTERNFDYSAIDETAKSAHLTREEFIIIAQQLELGQGEITTEAFSIVLDWIRQTKVNEALIKLTLLGTLAIEIKDGDVAFKKIVDI